MNRLIYRILRFNHALRYWVLTQFTPGGLGLLCAVFACGLIGIDIKRSVSYQIFTFLVALFIVSVLLLPFSRHRLEVSRVLPRFGTVGIPLFYRIQLHNPNRRRIGGVKLFEQFPNSFPTFQEFQHVFSRRRELQRSDWFGLLARKQWAYAPPQHLPSLPSKKGAEITGELIPLRRGILRFQQIVLACPEPLGFINRRFKVSLPQSVLVLPKRYQLASIELPGVSSDQPMGDAIAQSRSRTQGQSNEFRSLRDYRPGDSPRKIHWKSWAKTGRPIVKEEQDDHTVRHTLILDTFQKENYSEALEESIAIAASFAYTLQTQQSLIELVIAGNQAHHFTAGRSLSRTEKLLELLASIQPNQKAPFESILSVLRPELAAIGSCICILLDWDAQRKELIEQLQIAGVPTLAIVIEGEKGLSADVDRSCLSDRRSRLEVMNINNIQEALLKL